MRPQPSLVSQLCGALLALLCALPFTADAGDRHEGVATCASGLCHGATQPLGRHPIRQDEYFVWQQHDAHQGAATLLGNAQSRRIGERLGLQPASAPACLVCHGAFPPPAERGAKFQLADGIGCETCHGGSERWLAEHTRPGISLGEKVALGMTPTWQPQTRAALCQGCHVGDAAHPITHAMMVAGHPRLVFELDTFTALEPPHHDRDADYAERKGAYSPARDWLQGQATAADALLDALASGRAVHGIAPEWMFFDCTSCHHTMETARWTPRRMPGAVPGAVPLADASLLLLGQWLAVTKPALREAWADAQTELQLAMGQSAGATQAAAQRARTLLRQQVLPAVRESGSNAAQLRAVLRRLVAADALVLSSPALAEQTAMALTVLSDQLARIGEPLPAATRQDVDRLYASVRNVDRFDGAGANAALEALRRKL